MLLVSREAVKALRAKSPVNGPRLAEQRGDANTLTPVAPLGPQGGHNIYLRNLFDGGPPSRGGKPV